MSWIGLVGLLFIAYEMIKALRFNINLVRFEKTQQVKITKELLQKQSEHFTLNRLIAIAVVTIIVVAIQWSTNQSLLVTSIFGVLTLVESQRALKNKPRAWK